MNRIHVILISWVDIDHPVYYFVFPSFSCREVFKISLMKVQKHGLPCPSNTYNPIDGTGKATAIWW